MERAGESEGNEGRRRRHQGVAQPLGHPKSVAVASRLRQREPAGGSIDGLHAPPRPEQHATPVGLVQRRLQDDARAVRIREELPVILLVQRDADFTEEGDRLVDAVRLPDSAEEVRRGATEVGLRHRGVGDAASRAAADQNLRPRS